MYTYKQRYPAIILGSRSWPTQLHTYTLNVVVELLPHRDSVERPRLAQCTIYSETEVLSYAVYPQTEVLSYTVLSTQLGGICTHPWIRNVFFQSLRHNAVTSV